VFEFFSENSQKAVAFALHEALRSGADEITTAHLLVGLCRLDEGVAAEALHEAGASVEALRAVSGDPCEMPDWSGTPPFSEGVKAAFGRGYQLAVNQGHRWVSSEYLLFGLCDRPDSALLDVLTDAGLSRPRLRRDAIRLLIDDPT
jgi:ATP-dependent Clp protease ATP-binding subunit ClpA